MRSVPEKRLLICFFRCGDMSVREMIQDMINELTDALGDAEKHDSGTVSYTHLTLPTKA